MPSCCWTKKSPGGSGAAAAASAVRLARSSAARGAVMLADGKSRHTATHGCGTCGAARPEGGV